MPRLPPPPGKPFSSTHQPSKRRGPTDLLVRVNKMLGKVCEKDPRKRKWEVVLAEAILVNYAKGKSGVVKEMNARWWGPVDSKQPGDGDIVFRARVQPGGIIVCAPEADRACAGDEQDAPDECCEE